MLQERKHAQGFRCTFEHLQVGRQANLQNKIVSVGVAIVVVVNAG